MAFFFDDMTALLPASDRMKDTFDKLIELDELNKSTIKQLHV
jgi:hypothetical protein